MLEVTGPLFDGLYAFKQRAQMLRANPPDRRNETVKWVTREHPKTDRIACPWLIRKFIDPEAEIVYVTRDLGRHSRVQHGRLASGGSVQPPDAGLRSRSRIGPARMSSPDSFAISLVRKTLSGVFA